MNMLFNDHVVATDGWQETERKQLVTRAFGEFGNGEKNFPQQTVTTTLRTHGPVDKRVALFLERHFERLDNAIRALTPFSGLRINLEKFRRRIEHLLQECDEHPLKIKVIATQDNMFMMASKREERPDRENGVEVMGKVLVREHPALKMYQRDDLDRAYHEARSEGYYECLLRTADGYYTEGTQTNILAIKNGILSWFPRALQGITQEAVLELAQKNGITVREGALKINDPKAGVVDEVLLVGTGDLIVPVTSVPGIVIKKTLQRPITHLLTRLLEEHIEDYYQKSCR